MRDHPVPPSGRAHLRATAVSILVIEDDPEVVRLVRAALELEGWSVQVAPDGLSAQALVARRRPALVILDLMLPDVDGLAIAGLLRAKYGRTLPIVVMSAYHRMMEKATHISAYAYIPKPFDLDELVGTVRQALAGSER
jgi:DNA-binding response OmpR family regulator